MKRRAFQPREADIQKAIIQWARAHGIAIFRRNVGGAKLTGGRFVRFAEPGQSDLYGWTPSGKHFELEVKRPGQKPTVEQQAWLIWCAEAAYAQWVDNLDSAIEFFEYICEED